MPTIDNILRSGFIFGEGEDLLKFKFRMVNIMLFISMGGMMLFVALYYLGWTDMGETHARVNALTAIFCFFTFFWLRQSKQQYNRIAMITISTVMLSFTSALIFVPNDEFRMVWFVMAIIVAHLAVGRKFGLFIVIMAIATILVANDLFTLNLGTLTLTTAVTSLIIISLILSTYSIKFDSYESVLLKKNVDLIDLVNKDDLTGIMSRRYFMDVGNHYFSGSRRSKSSMSLMMLDIDHFKWINDSYGHHMGDMMLILFSDTISSYLRKSDVFARLGGEEFGIILFETDLQGAERLAEKIRSAIDGLLYQEGEITIRMTTSIGISDRRESDSSFDELLIRTDAALYRSKDRGRNCTSIAG
ncbi:MAG: GGDEF domain-containing protein [Gammaproteobacteria bacterium]|nr:GGDEF domain-containing protein [Gammaproteobacteria bacterium]